jgi:hypothetical protein
MTLVAGSPEKIIARCGSRTVVREAGCRQPSARIERTKHKPPFFNIKDSVEFIIALVYYSRIDGSSSSFMREVIVTECPYAYIEL